MKTYEELLAERDALAAKLALIQSEWVKGNFSTKCISIAALREVIESTPQQCLAEIKADAGRAGYFRGHRDASGINNEWSVKHSERHADEYAAKIRNTGTWLKDSNVNGGKRQGGEK